MATGAAESLGGAIMQEVVEDGALAIGCGVVIMLTCFPGHMLIKVVGKGEIPLEDVQVGDQIEAMDSAGKLVHNRVDFFLHRDPTKIAEFICFRVGGGRELVMTPDHQICVFDDDDGLLFLFARDVQEGMKLVVPTETRPELASITSIERQTFTGIYAPCTQEGTIVIAGFGCSCYAVVPHSDAHAALAQVRQPLSNFPRVANHGFHTAVRCCGPSTLQRSAQYVAGRRNHD
jgi:hypothetical protein